MWLCQKIAMYFIGLVSVALPISVARSSIVLTSGIIFNSGRPFLGESLETSVFDVSFTKSKLDNEALTMIKNPKAHFVVLGGTDNRECAKNECKDLSVRRAQYVTDWLLAHGVNPRQLAEPIGYGDTQPVATNDTEEGRQINRYAAISMTFIEK